MGIDAKADQELAIAVPSIFRLSITLTIDTERRPGPALRPMQGPSKGVQEDVRIPDRIEEVRNELYILWVGTLSPLKNEEFVLRPLPLEVFYKKPAEGILVSRKGRPNIGLYFDSESHLLVRMVAPVWREAGSVQRREIEFREHKPTDGLMLPTIQIDRRDGRQYAYWMNTTYQFPEKIDDSVFEKP